MIEVISSAPTASHLPQRGGAVPFPALGRVEMACQFPKGLILGRFSLGQLLVFYPCCPRRGHIWTAFLNPIDRPPISSTFFPTTLLPPQTSPLPILLTAASYPYASSHQR